MIVEAARGMDRRTLTMQAVADQLGVDRKALNYHVTDREGLLRLLAADVFESTLAEGFETHFRVAGVTEDDDWQTVLRAWAVTVRDSMVATGVVTTYFRLETDSLAVFAPAELVLQQMLRAGFDLVTAGRGLALATHLAMSVGRDIIMERQLGEHPQAGEVRRLLGAAVDDGRYPAFRGLTALEINVAQDADTQFDFELDVLVAGMEDRVAPSPPA